METIKRQIRAAHGCLVASQSPWALAKPMACRLYTRSSVTYSAAAAAVAARAVSTNR